VDIEAIREAAAACRDEMLEFLTRLLRFESFSGQEPDAQRFIAAAFSRLADTKQVPISAAILDDPDFVDQGQDTRYAGRGNVVVSFGGGGEGRSLILNTHSDVVAVGAGWPEAFRPTRSADGRFLAARGACDAKGCIATIWLLAAMLRRLGLEPTGHVAAHLVVEEEIGGNGTLSLVADGCEADGVIVLEPTKLHVHHAHRGAVWFDLHLTGRAAHMGRRFEGVNAVEKMMKIVAALNDYEQRLLARSRGYRGFERYEYPVQMNIGRIAGGAGHSIVADECHLAGGVGFLPDRSMREVMDEVDELIRGIDDEWIRDHYALTFTGLRNDSYEIDPAHPLPAGLAAAARSTGVASDIFGWNVSCDARLYARRLGIPTVIFGPGDIADAHSRGEKIEIQRILDAAVCLVVFILDWCGGK